MLKTHAVTPEPQEKTMGLKSSILFSLKILINSDFVLNVFILELIQFWNGMFFEPGIEPFRNSSRGSSVFP